MSIGPKNQNGEQKSYPENLLRYLYSDMENSEVLIKSIENLNRLINIYSNRKDMVLSFIGAGTSKVLGISDWKELMIELCRKANEEGFSKIFDTYDDNPTEWPNLAQEIFDHLKSINMISIYYDAIQKNMTPRFNSTNLTLIKMILAIDIHLTTNFDTAIENAYEFLKYISNQLKTGEKYSDYEMYFIPDFCPFEMGQQKRAICYLHGNAEKNIYILKKEDYDKYYPSVSHKDLSDSSLEDFLKICYKNKTILFIGHSFRDNYLKEYFFNLSKKIELEHNVSKDLYQESGKSYSGREPIHFLLIDEETAKEHSSIHHIHDYFQEFNIYVIIYKKYDHIFLELLFEFLSQRKQYVQN
jgi:hypothetical protein